MTHALPDHTTKVKKLLAQLQNDRAVLLDYYKSGHANPDGKLYAMDFYILGIVKRTLSNIKAMGLLIESWNLLAARTILRTHIDTAIRLHAAWIVNDPNEFVLNVMNGKQIDRMSDKNGEQMKDKHLISMLVGDYPWLKTVYDNLSGYIHFSDSHIVSPIPNIEDNGKFSMRLSEFDFDYPETSWTEVLECFNELTGMVIGHLGSYSQGKRTK
jgi:hypothetical protein